MAARLFSRSYRAGDHPAGDRSRASVSLRRQPGHGAAVLADAQGRWRGGDGNGADPIGPAALHPRARASRRCYISIEDLICRHADLLFPGFRHRRQRRVPGAARQRYRDRGRCRRSGALFPHRDPAAAARHGYPVAAAGRFRSRRRSAAARTAGARPRAGHQDRRADRHQRAGRAGRGRPARTQVRALQPALSRTHAGA